MSQITCCPNCSTSFRVTDAQLAAHQGKVRCGRCAFVFHAPDFIQAVATETSPPPVTAVLRPTIAHPESPIIVTPVAAAPDLPQFNAPAKAVAQPFSAIEKKGVGIELEANLENGHSHIPQQTADSVPQKLAQLAIEESELDAGLTKNAAFFDKIDTPMPPAQPTRRQSVEIDSDSEYQPILSDDDLFNQPIEPRSRWYWLWAVGCVLAALILIAQLGFVFRQTLSQEFPILRPKYLALCAQLNCSMPLPRQAQLLRSEYSELTFIPDNPKLIQLNATLRNLAGFEQELPKLELTLTDENEKVVVRKIFTAKEYLVQNERVQNSIEANEEVRAFLQLDLADLHSTGYSLYWFY